LNAPDSLQAHYAVWASATGVDTEQLFGLIVDLTKNALPRQHWQVAGLFKYEVSGRKPTATHGYELCALARRK
jgi:hypothetical protein